MSAKLKKFIASYRSDGLSAAARAMSRAVMSSVCDYQIVEVRGRLIMEQDPEPSTRENDSTATTECVIISTPAELQRYAGEYRLPLRDSLDLLRRRIEQGCVSILARRPAAGGDGYEIVGYSIMERGGFSAAGIKGRIAKDILFVHHTEVAEKYRGQRIAQVITRARNDYCRAHGFSKSCTAHRPDNTPSERAFRKFGSRLLCYAVRASFFRGLFVWHTPWRKIEQAIASLDSRSEAPEAETVVRSSRFEVRS